MVLFYLGSELRNDSKGPMVFIRSLLFAILVLFSTTALYAAEKALIIFEGRDLPGNLARGSGYQLYQLLGHFDIERKIIGSEEYRSGDMNKYPFVFFIGFTKDCKPSSIFLDDAYEYRGTLVWLNTGILEYHVRHSLRAKYGFEPLSFDTHTGFNTVVALDKQWRFTKSDPSLHLLQILDRSRVQVLAEAQAPGKKTTPYAIRSGNFYYFADSPLAYTTATDRYLFFAEKLHDILNQPHSASHLALIRIEDVHPLEDPDRIEKIADLLYSREVPFLISVIPFYVDPSQNIRVALSDKPDMVDALRYAQAHGGTIILHGATHQYRGITAVDYEFWDEAKKGPIQNDSAADVEKKIESAVIELMKNGLFPLAWETPHYGASNVDYVQIGKIFSTAVEQRLAINHLDYGQFFPYVINQDMYGQKILPENLGYVPLGKRKEMERAVKELIEAAQVNLYVRDGFATAFFHPFLPLSLLRELVDGVKRAGYTYIDIKNDVHSVRLPDRAIRTGAGPVRFQIDDQYLKEIYINPLGQTVKTEISPKRIRGDVSRNVTLASGWTYVAEPTEEHGREITFMERLSQRLERFMSRFLPGKREITPAVAGILWNPSASGGALLDQQSFYTALQSIGIPTEKILDANLSDLSKYNLLIVPYSSAEIMPDLFYEKVNEFVKGGGCLVTDSKNPVAADLGVRFGKNVSRLEKVRDKLFPDDVLIWGTFESVYPIDPEKEDQILCVNDVNQAPVGIVRKHGKGKLIAISARFDPVSGGGYARFPYFIEWLKTYFHLHPVLRRDFMEVYFDPGLHGKLNIEALVKRWSGLGIRVVHAAGWHEYPNYTYDYDRLIRLCHAYGIIVYAWLEPPQISKKLYDENPQWREKNYNGEDARFDWRYPMALTDPACLSAASEWMRKFLSSHDWDGVNIAEIYFGGEGAPEDPQSLTPFHPSSREEFKKKSGFDPVELFRSGSPHYYKTSPRDWKRFVDFRADCVTEITSHFISVASEVFRTKPDRQIILTILDQKSVPELRRKIGVDADRLLALRKRFHFAVQVEDPEVYWNKDPRRYLEIGERYRQLLGDDSSQLLIDLNILNFRRAGETGLFPTLTPTGIEAYLLVHSAASAAPRLTIYSEATILPQDLINLPYALAAATAKLEIDGDAFKVKAEYATTLRLDEKVEKISLDGKTVYPFRKGCFRIPAGEHVLKLSDGVSLFNNGAAHSQMASASCNILKERTFKRGVEFLYHSPSRCAVSFNTIPLAVFVDDQEMILNIAKEEQNYGILLPPGTHKVLVMLENTVAYGIDLTSLWSSELIAVFGFLAGGVLVVLFILVKVKKKEAIQCLKQYPLSWAAFLSFLSSLSGS